MRVVFMGSAELACRSLARLRQVCAAGGPIELVGAVTQPDRPSGRHRTRTPCPVKRMLADTAVPLWTPVNINTPSALDWLRERQPDAIAVVAYGQILKTPILHLPPLGCINLHASLLPRYRGAAPIQWAIVNDEAETGLTTIHMNERMDAGDIILQQPVPILAADTAASLHARLAPAGAQLLLETLEQVRLGTAPRRPQNEAEATMAPKLSKLDGAIDWRRPARDIVNRIRGFTPWPGSFCRTVEQTGSGKTPRALKVLEAAVAPGQGPPGQLLEVEADGLRVAAGRDAVRLRQVHPQGKRPMSGADYARGHRIESRLLGGLDR